MSLSDFRHLLIFLNFQVNVKLIESSVASFMAFILRALSDPAYSSFRLSILQVLGRLSRSTGCVIEPYLQFPNLMRVLFDIFKDDKNADVQLEV